MTNSPAEYYRVVHIDESATAVLGRVFRLDRTEQPLHDAVRYYPRPADRIEVAYFFRAELEPTSEVDYLIDRLTH